MRGTGGADTHDSIGFNFKLTNLQAAVGLGQLEKLGARLERIRQTYRIYHDELAGVKGIRVLPFKIDTGEQPPVLRDGSETLSILITGVPLDSTLNHGTSDGAGNWTLTPANLSGLSNWIPLSTTHIIFMRGLHSKLEISRRRSSCLKRRTDHGPKIIKQWRYALWRCTS